MVTQMKKIPKRAMPLMFSLYMSVIVASVMSLVLTALNHGIGDRKSNRMSTSMAHVWGVSGMHTGDCWVDFSKPVARDFSV